MPIRDGPARLRVSLPGEHGRRAVGRTSRRCAASGVDAQLVVFERYRLHPEADWSLDRAGGFATTAAGAVEGVRAAPAGDRRLPLLLRPDSRPEVAAVPDPRGAAEEVGAALPRLGHPRPPPEELAYSGAADAQIVGSYDAIRWVPGRPRRSPGDRPAGFEPVPPSDRERPLVVHAPSTAPRKGTEHVIAAASELDVELEIVEGLHHDEARRALRARRHRRRPAQRRLVRPVCDRGDGARQARRDVLHDDAVARTEEAFGVARAARARDEGDARRDAPAARRVTRGASPDRRGEPRLRGACSRRRRDRRAPARHLRPSRGRPTTVDRSPRTARSSSRSSGSRSTRRSTGSAASSRGSSPSSSCRSTRSYLSTGRLREDRDARRRDRRCS